MVAVSEKSWSLDDDTPLRLAFRIPDSLLCGHSHRENQRNALVSVISCKSMDLAMSNRLKSSSIQQKHLKSPNISWNPPTFHGNAINFPNIPYSSKCSGSRSGLGGGAPGAQLLGIGSKEVMRFGPKLDCRGIPLDYHHFPHGMAKIRNNHGNIIGIWWI